MWLCGAVIPLEIRLQSKNKATFRSPVSDRCLPGNCAMNLLAFRTTGAVLRMVVNSARHSRALVVRRGVSWVTLSSLILAAIVAFGGLPLPLCAECR